MHLQLRASRYAGDYILSSHTCCSIIHGERRVFPLRRVTRSLSLSRPLHPSSSPRTEEAQSLNNFSVIMFLYYAGDIFRNTDFNPANRQARTSSRRDISRHGFNYPSVIRSNHICNKGIYKKNIELRAR